MVVSDLAPGERKNSALLFLVGLAKFILVYRGLSLLTLLMANRWVDPSASFLVFAVCWFAQE